MTDWTTRTGRRSGSHRSGPVPTPHRGRRRSSHAPAPVRPGRATVAEVKAYVEANPDELDAVLAAETAGKNRSTLVDWLEAQAE